MLKSRAVTDPEILRLDAEYKARWAELRAISQAQQGAVLSDNLHERVKQQAAFDLEYEKANNAYRIALENYNRAWEAL